MPSDILKDPAVKLVPGAIPDAPIRLLVVEDNNDDQELLLRLLRKARIREHILFVSDGAKAIDLLVADEIKSIFAIFLDLNVHGASGIEVLRHIRSKPEIAEVPVIIMTEATAPEDIEECQKLKVASFIAKPVSFQSFSMAIANIFHQPPSGVASA